MSHRACLIIPGMKVLWIVLGVLGGLCLICAGGGYFLFSKGKGMIDEAGKFGDASLRAISANWSIDEFNKRAAPEIGQQNGKEAIPALLTKLSTKLGPLKGDFTSHLTNINAQNNNGASAIYVDWDTHANFEKGEGDVTMQLISRNGKWQILKFNVDSPALQK